MAANRKLLAEIQQVLKKVEEGVLVFDEVWEKVYSAPQQTLKEKYEADLKKEIKKLQRLRDQIKAWISSNEVKDKNGLVEARKTIESKMEQFKICEKDTKTKAFSKEGLAREAKLDPKEALKVEKLAWVNECLEKLADIINSDEADKEKLVNAKGKAKNKDQIEKFDNRLVKHRWHETRLELIIKLVENDELDAALLEGIKDSLEYYLESAADDEGASNPEDEFDIYEDLQLDTIVPEAELKGSSAAHNDDEAPASSNTKEEVVASAVSAAASAAPVSAVKIPAGAKAIPAAQAKATTASTAAPAAAAKATAATPAAPAASGKTAAAVVAAGATTAAAPPSLTAAAGAKPTTAAAVAAGGVKPAETKKSLASIVAASAAAEEHSKEEAAAAAAPVPAAATPAPGLSWATAAAKVAVAVPAAPTAAPAAAVSTATPPPPVLVASQPTPAALPSMTPAPPTLVKPASAAPAASTAAVPPPPLSVTAPTAAATAAAQTPAPPALNPRDAAAAAASGSASGSASVTSTPLVGSASPALSAVATPTAMPPPLQHKVNPEMMLTLNMLKASMLLTPESLEPEKAPYTPRNFYQHGHASYPSVPLFSTHAENSAWFERLPMDTLFFVFYFQQGTYQQYLAAKQLKKHSWRFHKKYMTWFQRHEEPKIATEEYEEGTYVYFDYESGWCQRIKSEFKFEYAYLEDELTSNLDG